MSYTLSDLIFDTSMKLGQVFTRTATGGSTTTVIDTSIAGQGGDDDWNDGTLIVRYTTDGNAPQGEFARITDYVNSTGTFTFAALTASVGAGDTYAYTTARWPLEQMIQLANMGLRALGWVTVVDTSLTTTAATEYDWSHREPLRIDVQTNDETDNNNWMELRSWKFEHGEVGSDNKLILPELDTGKTLRVWYQDFHPQLSTYSDEVSQTIHPEVAIWAVVVEALKWMNSRTQGEQSGIVQDLNDARQELDNAKTKFPIRNARRTGKVLIV